MATQKNKSSSPKRQHYISQFYLNWFSDSNEKIWIYDREKNEYRNQISEKVAKIKNYYSYLKENGDKSNEVDEMLQNIETAVSTIFRKINKRKSLNRENKTWLAVFCVCLMTRTPEHESLFSELATKSFREIVRKKYSSLEKTKEILKKEGKSELSAEKIYESAHDDSILVKPDKVAFLRSMINALIDLPPYLLAKDWQIYNSSSVDFITSDNPFITLLPDQRSIFKNQGFGINTPDTIKYLPISSRACLYILDDGKRFSYGDISSDEVKERNKNIALHSKRFIFAKSKVLLEEVVHGTKINEYQKDTRVFVSNSKGEFS